MAYTLKREDIYGFASSIGAVTSQRGDELYFRTCPYCDGGAHHDVDTFSINLESGAFCCLRASCGQKGHFVELCRDFDYELEYEVPRIYRQLPQPKKAIKSTDAAVEYLKSRGISEAVCRKFEITAQKDNPTVLVFPFYDEKGVLRFIKYRNTLYRKNLTKGAKEWAERDTMPILFGMKQVPTDAKTLIITEGQCFDGEAEVFTQNGWVRFGAYQGQPVMQVTQGMTGKFTAPIAIVKKPYKGDMVETSIGGNYYSFTTPDHNIVYRNPKGEIIKRAADKHVSTAYHIPTTVLHKGSGLEWSNDLIALYLAVSADGTIDERTYGSYHKPKSRYYARFGLKKQRKIDRLCGILERLGIEYSDNPYLMRGQGYHSICFHLPDEISSKLLPWEFAIKTTIEQKKFILRELLHWDGCKTANRNQGEYYTIVKHNADVVQAIAHTCGCMATIYRKRFGSNYYDDRFGYRVSILFGKDHVSTQQRDKNTQNIPYDDMVYCVSVPTGMILVRQNGKITVTGNCDSLSLAEAGYDNAVSVPTGASGFTWLVPCREFIERFDEIIVFGDWEHGKMSLLDTLKARVTTATIKAVRRVDYLGEKDANDILRKYGTGALRKAIENAEVPKLQNVKDLSTVTSVDVNQLDRIKTGIDAVDRTIYGMCMGQVILVYGKRGEGKSNLMSQIICNALDQNESVFAYSGELSDYHFKRWIDYQLAGSENVEEGVNEYGDPVYTVPEEIVEQINLWYKGRAFLFDNEYLAEDDDEFEGLIKTIERVIRQYGTRLICIDNLMTAMEVVTEKDSLFLAQSNFVGQLKKIAMKYQVVILLVAHARKTGEKLTNDDVSGSADITNKVDVVMSYARTENENESAIQILKNRLFGKLRYGDDSIKVKYSPKTKRIFDVNEYVPKRYGWERLAKRSAEAEKPNTDEWERIDLANPPWKKDVTGDLWNDLF